MHPEDVGIKSTEKFAALDVTYAMVSSQTLLFHMGLITCERVEV